MRLIWGENAAVLITKNPIKTIILPVVNLRKIKCIITTAAAAASLFTHHTHSDCKKKKFSLKFLCSKTQNSTKHLRQKHKVELSTPKTLKEEENQQQDHIQMISSISHSSLVDLPSLDNNKTKLLSSTRSVRRRNALATDVYCPKLNTNIYKKNRVKMGEYG